MNKTLQIAGEGFLRGMGWRSGGVYISITAQIISIHGGGRMG